jgi:superfamily I DNA/RNA helicase
VQALQSIKEDPDLLESRMRNNVAQEVEAVEAILDQLEGALEGPVEDELERLLAEADLDRDSDEALETACRLIVELIPEEEEPTLGDVETAIQGARGSYDESEEDHTPDRVRIMTMHSAKGLTARAVIVAACEDELLPGALADRRDLDDQRRLLYVSLTRAERHLFVTYARRRDGRQSQILQAPVDRTFSRFLRDYLRPEDFD